MLHSRTLRYLDEVARCGSIRGASERLRIAASAINKHLLKLEDQIGEPLFERLPRGLRPTPAGEILLAHARRTLKEYSQVQAEIRDLKTLQGGEVIVATMNGLAGGIVAHTAAAFQARHPQVRLSIHMMFAPDIVQAVTDAKADLGVAFNLPNLPPLEVLANVEARLGAVLTPGHPLAAMKSLPLAMCQSYPLILADHTMLLQGIIRDAFDSAGLDFRPTFLTNSVEAMKALAISGAGIAFLSKVDIAQEQVNGLLTYRPVREFVSGKNILAVVQRDKRVMGLAATMFAEELARALSAAVG
ncbi:MULTISPECIES: LysR family transcriptional regulator [unclassified Paracoccus (in: a-proteobacteria)]|uniref:LysR family transcriptional regulator n=1 Tax=unclassified Paracoccus (in: a-proteobacteria) TaxID=2688777 RepID=UPI0012B206DF|nr:MULTISPECIES: LysR family transcriptional regulator [unclassified Paracoccus (in: a-proteobacteria)]UXU75461.1 LysR family transcriptional regulator [Paracoccus sp. SMMA_5]UXU81366.1 LysR family transcriptional regulator [Paracoccus sp. SMMA_5_TC]